MCPVWINTSDAQTESIGKRVEGQLDGMGIRSWESG